ncbi:MAG: diacylglycerol/lipid kinase family protein [Vulcanimicrobiaceae bacterium]
MEGLRVGRKSEALLAIFNAHAAGNSAKQAEAVAMLRQRGCTVTVVDSQSVTDTLDAIRNSGDIAGVVIGGGDGSISAALPAILERKLPIGVLPLGTANDFARSIGVADLNVACDAIASGNTRSVDLGTANGRPFLNVVAIGLPAQAARELTAKRKRLFGMFAAVAAAPSIARHRRTFTLNAEIDNQVLTARCEAVLASVGRYLGGVPVAYEDIEDGKLHLTACRVLTLREALSLAFSIIRRTLQEDDRIIERSGTSITLQTTQPLDVAIDGDICAKTPITVRVLPRALLVFSP